MRLPVLTRLRRALTRAMTHRQMASQTVADFDLYEDVRVALDGREFYATVVAIQGDRMEVTELTSGTKHCVSPTQTFGM
jgi:hypothetical protein